MDADGNYLLAVVSEGNVITAYTLSQLSKIEKLVEAFGIRSIVINELVSYPQVFTILDFLLELKNRNPDLEFTYYLHDFYCVCPSYTLIDHSLSYCGIPQDLSYCDNCLRTHPMKDEFYAVINRDYPGLTMQRWRSEFGSLLSYCSRIICFSENSKNLLVQAHPLLDGRITVIPHQVDWVRKVNLPRKHTEINIAVIGNIGFSKGADIVSGLAAHIAGSRKKMRIHIFGQIYPGQPANLESNPRVIFHGAYRKTDLPVLMEDYHIDIVFISSIWPETFSYTTEEAIQMEMPVAVFNLGAPVERVREYNKGLILSSTEPASIVREIEDFIKTLEG